jgi:replication factor A1
VQSINIKSTGSTKDKRNLTLVDESGNSINMALWGNIASIEGLYEGNIAAFKGVKISNYNGKSLNIGDD